MPEGTHELLFYNNDTEYIVFDGVAASESATATTRGVTRSSFHELHAGERTVNQPDMLYGAYMEEYTAEKTLAPTELPVTLRPLVYTYMIRYEFADGRYFYVGTPDTSRPGERYPLVLALSEDGYNFDKTFILSDDRYTQQYKGRWKGGDYGYPYAMVHDGYIYVIVSRRKERIEIIRIEIDTLQ